MVAIKIAKELNVEIRALEMRIEQLEREHYGLEKIRDTHRMDAATYYDQKIRLEEAIKGYRGILEDKTTTRDDIKNKLKELGGIEYKVGAMKIIEGKTLERIAEELGYSVRHIERVHSNVRRMIKDVG